MSQGARLSSSPPPSVQQQRRNGGGKNNNQLRALPQRNKTQMNPYTAARNFYEEKLENNPNMPRYLHFMSALTAAESERNTNPNKNTKTKEESGGEGADLANSYFRRTIESDPNNVMARNDYAVYLSRQGRKEDAINEFRKARIIVHDNALLEKNSAAVLGNTGRFLEALDAATRARYLNSSDAQNHRNLAKLQSTLGDGRAALRHNLQSIALEHRHPQATGAGRGGQRLINTSAHRAAAVQIIAQGGDRADAVRLMNTARVIENKKIDLLTSTRTYEIIADIKRRYGNTLQEQEKKRQEEEQQRRAYEAEAAAYLKERLDRKSKQQHQQQSRR